MNIEVEVRSFVSQQEYERLKEFFTQNVILDVEDEQETYYYDCEQDVRIQKNTQYAKIWLKKGKLHDDYREEIEVKTSIDEFEQLKKLFDALGYSVQIKWLRHRLKYKWNDVTVCLDKTAKYGNILELEQMSSEDKKNTTYAYLLEQL